MEVTIKLSVDDLNVIIKALERMPYGEVSKILPNIVGQGQAQVDASQKVQEKPV